VRSLSRILVIGDVHEPATHPGYRAFVSDLYAQWDCDRVVFIGDITDNAFCSFWDPDIDHDGINAQIDKSRAGVAKWVESFPVSHFQSLMSWLAIMIFDQSKQLQKHMYQKSF